MFGHGEGVERVLPFLCAADDEHVLAALFARKPLREAEGLHLLVHLRDLAHGAGGAVAEHFQEQGDVAVYVLRGRVKEERARKGGVLP